MVRLEMTRDEARLLEMFLLMTTKYREDQVKAYRKLLENQEKYRDVSKVTLQTYADNAQHWVKQCEVMEDIRKKVSELLGAPSEI